MSNPMNNDILIVGGGVVGLTLAYELAGRGQSVCVVDAREMGREASWAGAGIIPPGAWYSDHPTIETLAALSGKLLPTWLHQFHETTGIDTGWRVCGAVYLTHGMEPAAMAHARGRFQSWRRRDIECSEIDAQQLVEIEPKLATALPASNGSEPVGVRVPREAQLRNPRFLQSLVAACRQRGVQLVSDSPVENLGVELGINGSRLTHVETPTGRLSAEQICIAAGCWSGKLASQLGIELPIRPVRGQMLLLKSEAPEPFFSRTIHQAGRYVVSRDDGHVLVGSTVENAGFSVETTAAGLDKLRAFASQFGLDGLREVKAWAGLRPATADGLPYMGRLPGLENGWISAGHYRAGLQMSPALAVIMAALIQGDEPPVDVGTLTVDRIL